MAIGWRRWVWASLGLVLILLANPVYGQVGGGGIPEWAVANRPANAPLAVPKFDRMQADLEQTGTTRVIVRFREASTGFAAEGSLANPAEVVKQRGKIRRNGDQLLQRLPAKARQNSKRFDYIPYLALEVDAAAFSDLLNAPEIDLIEEDLPVPPALSDSVPLIGGDGNGLFLGYSGAGQTVAILDTGVDKTHPFLANKVVDEACFSTNGSGVSSLCPNGSGEQLGAGSGTDCNTAVAGCGHGTHVAGIAAGKGAGFSGVAKDASIIAIQVFSRFNSCPGTSPCAMSYISDQIKALNRIYELRHIYNIAAVNMSLGGGSYSSACDSSHGAIKMAIDNLKAVGIATVIASGNNGFTGSISSPACVSTAVSVGATTKSDVLASYSNSVSWLSLLAPGSAIESSTKGGGYASWSGTSMATPHVAGAWAVMKSKKPTASVDEVLSALQGTGTPVSGKGVTRPRIRVSNALGLLASGNETPGQVQVPQSSGTGIYTITWAHSAPPGTWYELQEATDSEFTSGRTIYVGAAPGWTVTGQGNGVFYYRVRIVFDPDTTSGWQTGGNACAISMGVCAKPVSLTVPATSNTGKYTVSWGASATSGVSYELWEATDALFTQNLRRVYGGTGKSIALTQTLGGSYYYRVRAVKTGLSPSLATTASAPVVVTLECGAPASLTVPASTATGELTLSWKASNIAGATYTLEQASSADFSSALSVAYSGTATSIKLTGLSNGTYFFRVKAGKAGFAESAWTLGTGSSAVTLGCTVPATLTVPATSSTGAFVVTWGAANVAGATYTLQEAKDAGFTTGLRTLYNGSALQSEIAGLTDGRYFYRVKASKAGFVDSPWKVSTPCQVTLQVAAGLPIPAFGGFQIPASNTTGSISLTWTASSLAAVTYEVQEATNAGFTQNLRTAYKGTAPKASVAVSVNGSYWYRIRATKTGYAPTAWVVGGNACSVTLACGTPDLLTVPTSSTTGKVALKWTASTVAGATYEVQKATNATFTAGVEQIYLGTALTATVTVPAGGNLYFRVRAQKAGFADSGWRAGGSACYVPPACGVPASITYPTVDSLGSLKLSWGASNIVGVTYRVEKATHPSFNDAVQVYQGTATTATVSVETDGTYYFRVRASKAGYSDSDWRSGTAGCVVDLTVPTPASITVPKTNTTGSIALAWAAPKLANLYYAVEEAKTQNFSDAKIVYVGTAVNFTLTGRTTGSYYYRVKAYKTGYSDSQWKAGLNACVVQLP